MYNYADCFFDFSMLYLFSIANFRIVQQLYKLGDNLNKSKFTIFYQVFSIIASTCTGIKLIYKKSGMYTIILIDS